MKPTRLILVLPCFGLDDFPQDLAEGVAADFHQAWTSLWHPQLLHRCRSLPEWKRSDSASLDVENALILLPECVASKVDTPLRERMGLANAVVDSAGRSRKDLAGLLLASIESLADSENQPAIVSKRTSEDSLNHVSIEPHPSPILPSLPDVDDFYALGYAYFQIQMLTRKIRYSSNLNQPLFEEQLQKGADAAVAGDPEATQTWLQSCFDLLSQERDHYFSQSAYLWDVCLLSETTLGAKWLASLETARPVHYLASAALLAKIHQLHPEAAQRLEARLAAQEACLLGGLHEELSLAGLSQASLHAIIAKSRQSYQAWTAHPPKVFASYVPCFTSHLGSILKHHGYEGALVMDWQGDSYPKPSQSKITWESDDGVGLDAIANGICDANASNDLLTLGARLATQCDYHQTPTLILAHWPGRVCAAFQDLVRCTEYSPSLGLWSRADDYFATTQRPYHQQKLAAEKFVPHPNWEDAADASGYSAYWQEMLQLEASRTLRVLSEQILAVCSRGEKKPSVLSSDQGNVGPKEERSSSSDDDFDAMQLALAKQLRQHLAGESVAATGLAKQSLAGNLVRLQQALPRAQGGNSAATSGSWLFLNASTGPQRVFWEGLPGQVIENRDARVYAAEPVAGGSDVVIDVPPLGFVRVEQRGAGSGPALKRTKAAPIGTLPGTLGNEFLECHIDPKSGRVNGIYIANRRGNRLSGMLALRVKLEGSKKAAYTEMRVDRIEMVKNHSVCGHLAIQGGLYWEKDRVADFALSYRLWRGSRTLEVMVEKVEVSRAFQSQVAYVAWRTAWPDLTALLYAWPNESREAVTSSRFRSPLLVEIDEVEHKAFVLSGGLPFHQRVEDRFLDTWLDRSTLREPRRLGLAIDLPRPYQNAMEWLNPAQPLADPLAAVATGSSAWFFQCNQSNVQVGLLDTLRDGDGKCTGVLLSLRETSGMQQDVLVECFRTPVRAERVNATGHVLGTLEVVGDAMKLSLRGCERVWVRLNWS